MMNPNQYHYNLTESLGQFDNDKRQWENAINCYRGNDPLSLWWRYICWLEQNIHLDTENQFRKSLEQCLSMFENFDAYKNDSRMVKLWIKYIDMQANQPQLYQMLYQRGIGIHLAAFYIAWAHYYDSAAAFKQAESIFNLALQTNAQPMEELKAAQNRFRMSVAQRMLYNDGSSKKRSADSLAEQRHQITTLNPSNAASAATNTTSSQGGQQPTQPHKRPREEEPIAPQEQQQQQTTSSYYQYQQPQYDTTPPTLNNSANVISSSLSFVYDETKIEDSNQVDYSIVYDYESGIQLPQNHAKCAKNHHEMWRVSLYLDEPFESKRCFYQRHLVYPGDGTEYSPEEIRARKWFRRLEEIKERKRILHQRQEEERIRLQQERQKQILKHQQEEKRRQQEEQQKQQELAEREKQQQIYLQNQYRNYVPNYGIKQPQNNDDIEDQIEASTISFSSGEDGTNKRITIKFKKERTVETHEIQPAEPIAPIPFKQHIPKKKPKQPKYSVLSSYDQQYNGGTNNAAATNGFKSQVEDANLLLSLSNPANEESSSSMYTLTAPETTNEDSYSSFSGENSCNGFGSSTPIRRPSAKTRKNNQDNLSYINEDSLSSYTDNYIEDDEETKKRKREKALQTIETHLQRKTIDPFSTELCKAFLTKLDFPTASTENCALLNYLPRFAKGQNITLGGSEFFVDREVGRGTYGSVYRALDLATNDIVALKYQKPTNCWEFYICQQIRKRCINKEMLPGFMHISLSVVAQNCTVFVSEFSSFGSLLDINNKIRAATTKVMHESLVMHFTYQILSIVQHLHTCKIVHADIKPDNFLLMKTPNIDSNQPTLRLIDFGCAIDMTLFEKGTEFTKVIQTDGFTCTEMMEGKPWSYQTDLFCVAGTIHVMLFGEYMTLNKSGKAWEIKNKYPRYLKKHVWTEMFNKLLNIKDIKHLPDLDALKQLLDNEIWNMESELHANIRTLGNLIKPPIIKRNMRKSGMNKSGMDKSGIYNNSNNSLTTYTSLETVAN